MGGQRSRRAIFRTAPPSGSRITGPPSGARRSAPIGGSAVTPWRGGNAADEHADADLTDAHAGAGAGAGANAADAAAALLMHVMKDACLETTTLRRYGAEAANRRRAELSRVPRPSLVAKKGKTGGMKSSLCSETKRR